MQFNNNLYKKPFESRRGAIRLQYFLHFRKYSNKQKQENKNI